jgi:hypothetical protein
MWVRRYIKYQTKLKQSTYTLQHTRVNKRQYRVRHNGFAKHYWN